MSSCKFSQIRTELTRKVQTVILVSIGWWTIMKRVSSSFNSPSWVFPTCVLLNWCRICLYYSGKFQTDTIIDKCACRSLWAEVFRQTKFSLLTIIKLVIHISIWIGLKIRTSPRPAFQNYLWLNPTFETAVEWIVTNTSFTVAANTFSLKQRNSCSMSIIAAKNPTPTASISILWILFRDRLCNFATIVVFQFDSYQWF